MHILKTLVFALAVLISFSSMARELAPIADQRNILVQANSGKELTADDVKLAIQRGAGEKGWSTEDQGDGMLIARINVRQKHTVELEIPYSAKEYSLIYKNSGNLNYELRNGVPYIHPNYNRWIQYLKDEISSELLKL